MVKGIKMKKSILLSFSLVLVFALSFTLGLAGAPAAGADDPNTAAVETGDHGLGLQLSNPDPSYKIDMSGFGSGMPLAAAVDLSAGLPPIGDQGAHNSCVGWACGYYYKSWWEKQEHASWDLTEEKYQFSPAYVYNQINHGQDNGSSFVDAMNLLESYGCTDQEEFPYGTGSDYTKQPTSDQIEAGKQYRIPSSDDDGYGCFFAESDWGPYTRQNVTGDLKTWLNAGRPLVLGMPIYDDFYLCGDYYNYDGFSAFRGGHAVFVAGYDDNAGGLGMGGFLVVNSWGPAWNTDGKVYLSYDFVQNYVAEGWYITDRDSNPKIDKLNPRGQAVGGTLNIYGDNFGSDRRNANITFPGAGDVTVYNWTNDQLVVKVPTGATDGNVYVYDWDNDKSNGAKFRLDPLAANWMLAEGATWPGFDEWVLIQNPGSVNADVKVTFITPQGEVAGPAVTVPAESRTTIHVNEYVPNQDVSTMVEVTNETDVCAERAMYINTADGKWGSHDCIGTKGSSDTWYLAEGATWPGYDEWVLVMNPYDESVVVKLEFQTGSGAVAGPYLELGPRTRETVHVNDLVPLEDVSTQVKCTEGPGVVAERAMYISAGDGKRGCHNSVGLSEIGEAWGLAEGATWPGFEEWVLVQNPGETAADVEFVFMTPEGWTPGPEMTVGAGSRASVRVNDYLQDEDVSTLVYSNTEGQDIVVERAMYINTADGKQGAHNAPGSLWSCTGWYLPEGATWPGFEEWVLVQNPDPDDAVEIKLTFMTPSGAVAGPQTTLEPGSRQSFRVNDYVADQDVSTKVETTAKDTFVVAERAMYMSASDGKSGSHDSLGVLATELALGGKMGCCAPVRSLSPPAAFEPIESW